MTEKRKTIITSGPIKPKPRHEYLFKALFSLPEPWTYEQEKSLYRELNKALRRFEHDEEILSLLRRGELDLAVELATDEQELAMQDAEGKWVLKEETE